MIQHNETESPEEREAKRVFTNILQEAHSHWGEISYDPDKKTASGVMDTSDGKIYTAELSYNDLNNKLSLMVRLDLKRSLLPDRRQQVLRFQHQRYDLMSFLTVDEETPLAIIRALTAVPEREHKCVVASIFSDTYTLLEDDALNQLIN